jgi:hypothetical protein
MREWMERTFPGPNSAPTRVGLLDTGELVLMDALGRSQVISRATAELIRTTLNRAAAHPP